MTRDLRNKARAVFLATLMVVSVFGGTMAFAGSAAAASGLSVDSGAPTTADGQITVSVSLDETTDGTGSATFQLEDSDEDTSSSITVEDNGTEDSDSATGAITTTIDLSSYSNIDAEGETTLYVNESDSINVGNGEYDTAQTFSIDNTRPTASSPIAGTTISTTTPTITVEMTEDQTSINKSTIEVTASSSGNQLFELNEPEAQGISYSESDQNLTIDISDTKLDALPEKKINFNIRAQDAAGNQLEPTPSGFSFTVDTSPVGVTINAGELSGRASSGDSTSTSSQTFSVDISNQTAAIDTASVTITGANEYQQTLSKADGDGSYESGTWTFDVAADGQNGNFPTLPDGPVTITASATDTDGQQDSDSHTFTVDTAAPVVVDNGVSINNGNVVNKSNDDSVPVSVTFNETVQANTVRGEIHLDDDGTAEVTLGDGQDVSPVTEDKGSNVETVNFEVDLSSDGPASGSFENASASVRFTSASDDTGDSPNANDSLTGSESFEIDTVDPTATIDNAELPGDETHPLQNVVDLSEAFSASNADGNSFELYVSPGQSGNYVPLSDVSNEPLADFDTTTLPEGTHTLKINVTDAAGNTVESTVDVKVDNYAPSISYDGDDPLTGMESGTEYDVADLVSVSDNGTVTISTYGYVTIADGETKSDVTYPDEFTTGADQSVTVDSNTNYVFGVELTDGTTLKADAVSTSVLSAGSIGVTAERNASDTGAIDVTVTSDSQLTSLNVTASTEDSYVTQSSETLSDFDESGNSEDGFEYTLTYETARDGQYKFALADATAASGLSIEDPGVSDTAQADASAPSLDSAYVTGADASSMAVQLTFSEPISSATFDQSFQGESVTAADASATDGDGVVNVTVDNEVQTSGDTELAVTSVSEEFGASTDETTETSADVMFSLELSEGVNVVSVPAETGSVSIDSLDLAGVNSIWGYDDGTWTKHVVATGDGSLTALEGGEGYVINATENTEVDYEVENTPVAVAGEERNGETLEAGWNLVGHFQEGSQDVDQAFVDLTGVWSVEDGYTGTQPQTLSLEQGYWAHVNQDGLYRPVSYDGPQSEQPEVFNYALDAAPQNDGYRNGDSLGLAFEVSHDQPIDEVRVISSDLSIDTTLTFASDATSYDKADAATVGEPSAEAISNGEAAVTVAVVDIYGNTQYVTKTVSVDSTNPTITGVTQNDADSDGNIDEAVLTFSEPIASGTVDASDFRIGTKTGDGLQDNDDNKVTVTLTDATDDGVGSATVDVSYTAGDVADLNGNKLADTTVAAGDITDNVVPQITNVVGTTVENGGDTIEVTFSEEVSSADAAASWEAFSVSQSGDLTVDKAGFSYDSGTNKLTVTLDEGTDGAFLKNGETVTVDPASGAISDGSGQTVPDAAVDSSASVTGDTAVPSITGIEQKDSDSDGNIDEAVLTFSEKIDDSSVEAQDFTIDGVQATQKSTGTANDNTMTVSLDTSDGSVDDGIGTAAVAVDYTAGRSGSTGVTDLAGNALADVTVNADGSTSTGGSAGAVTITDSADVQVKSTSIDTNANTVTLTFTEDVGPNGNLATQFDNGDFSYTDSDGSVTVNSFTESDSGTATVTIALSGTPATSDEVVLDTTVEAGDGSTISSPVTLS